MNDGAELWFGYYGNEYDGDEPAFFDDDFPWKKFLEDNFETIRDELSSLMTGKGEDVEMKPYFDDSLQFPPKNWKTIGLCFWGNKRYENMLRFPRLTKIISDIPGLVTASFNLLEPGSEIKPHFGETNGTYRVHLGVKIPAGLPDCGFRVKDEVRPWEEGKALVFLDANIHAAFNHSEERRYVLLLDIIRPEFMSRKQHICIKSLAILTLYFCLSKIPFLTMDRAAAIAARLPRWFLSGLIIPFRVAWYLFIFCKELKVSIRRDL